MRFETEMCGTLSRIIRYSVSENTRKLSGVTCSRVYVFSRLRVLTATCSHVAPAGGFNVLLS